ncbi:mannose-1-phosphate guanyltransferase [bacterium]|nr:mannose-1-phosphate guanyltransferase [bacterium]
MKAMIMAGGFGTRLRPLTCSLPKPMVPMVNRPMLEHIIDLLKRHGFTEMVMALYFQPEVIQEYFGDGSNWGVKINYILPDSDLGTAGCVKNAADFFGKDTFLVISGDVLTNIDLTKAIAYHKDNQSLATIVLTREENPLAYGVVITREDGRISRFLEKPSWGEVFSDTINSGIYIMESSVLDRIPEGRDYDFSKQLFPEILAAKAPLYGYVAEDAYWKDVGNLTEYRQAHYDAIRIGVTLAHPGKGSQEKGNWIGADCFIDPTAVLEEGVVLGEHCWIGPHVRIANTVLGKSCRVGESSKIIGSVIWDNVTIGNGANLKEVTICSDCRIGARAYVGVGAVVADHCQIGEDATVKAEVKVWPYKIIEDGTTLSTSLIWGERWSKHIFDAYGVSGLGNIEITPEFAAKLGAAYGASLKKGDFVMSSRDNHKSSRIIDRAIMTGLASVGVNVYDLRVVPIPVARYSIRAVKVTGGFHVRKSPYNPKLMDIKFFDNQGKELSSAKEKGIENLFFREDFSRADMEEAGEIMFPQRALEYYQEGFVQALNHERIRKGKFKVVIDYAWGSAVNIFPQVLGDLHCEVVALNSYPDGTRLTRSPEELDQSLVRLGEIVGTLKADVGIMLDAGAQKIFIADNLGRVLEGEHALALMALLVMKAKPGARIAVPISATQVIETMAETYQGTVIRLKTQYAAMLDTASRQSLDFVGEARGGYVFPEFQPAFDAMMATAKLLELMAAAEGTLSDFIDTIPPIYLVRQQVPCSWEKKGVIMRRLIESTRQDKVELVDGVKVWHGKSWVLIMPDADKPVFHISAEGANQEQSQQLALRYCQMIQEWQA